MLLCLSTHFNWSVGVGGKVSCPSRWLGTLGVYELVSVIPERCSHTFSFCHAYVYCDKYVDLFKNVFWHLYLYMWVFLCVWRVCVCVCISLEARRGCLISSSWSYWLVVNSPEWITKNSGSLEDQQTFLEGISSKSYNFFVGVGRGAWEPNPKSLNIIIILFCFLDRISFDSSQFQTHSVADDLSSWFTRSTAN